MDTRSRKKCRVVDFSSQDDHADSQSEDLMCGQFYDDDAFIDKSSSDVDMFSEVSFFIIMFLFLYV